MPGRAGHRCLPHTADLRLEAWGPTREECLAQAVAALAGSVADLAGHAPRWTTHSDLTAAGDADALRAVLDEVIYVLDTAGAVPVVVRVEPRAGGVRLHLGLVPVGELEVIGPAPKAVTLHGLRIGRAGAGWSCEATVDV